jgi:bifunctional non-homologous end joining protein LigD
VLKVRDGWLRYSESFTNGAKLFVVADRMGLEGIVSKMASMPYRSGPQTDWVKVKSPGWRERNRDRRRLFERR